MKKLYAVLLLQIIWGRVIAQTDPAGLTCYRDIFCCTTCPGYPFNNIQRDNGINYKKLASSDYPGDTKYAIEDGPTNDDCDPLGGADCDESGDILYYDVYYPADHEGYLDCPLPVVVFVHGGGFSECEPMNPNSDECEYFAKRGFVCFNISYRIGTRLTPRAAYAYFTVQQQLAVYRASQDVRGAIRSIIKRQQEQDALPDEEKLPYQVNTDWIFLAGASAGAITVLNVAYYNQAMLNSINRNSGTKTIVQALGLIDADYYYGGTDIAYAGKIKAVCNQWGSVSVPGEYYADSLNAKNFFTREIPVISFHGQQDNVVPFYVKDIKYAEYDNTYGYGSTYVSETTCLLEGVTSFSTDDRNDNNPDFATFGSYSFFHHILQSKNIPSELYVDCQAKHGLRNAGPIYLADYGTGYTNAAQTTEYIAERASVFFKNVMSGNAQARQNKTSPETDKVFLECRNSYNKCNTLQDINAGCSNDAVCN